MPQAVGILGPYQVKGSSPRGLCVGGALRPESRRKATYIKGYTQIYPHDKDNKGGY